MPDLCPKGVDLGVKPSTPPCPPTLPPYPGLQAEAQTALVSVETQTETQTVLVSVETQTETQTVLVSVETQIEIRTAHVEVQTTPVSVRLQTTLVSVETQTIEVRNEREDRRQRDKEKQVSPIYPWDMCRAARETEGQPLMLLPLHEVSFGRNYQSMRVNKPFSYQEIQKIKEDLGYYLEDPEKYIRAFKGVTLHYDLTWKDVMYILGQTLTPDSKARILGKAVAYGDEWLGN